MGKRLWRRCGVVVLSAALFTVEVRDLYARAVWLHTLPQTQLQLRTGDVLLISNRWYALPSLSHVVYSFACKLLWKTSWDEVAVVVRGGRVATSSSSTPTPSSLLPRSTQGDCRSTDTNKNVHDNNDDDDDDGGARVLYCDMTGAHEMSLCRFLTTRMPRGAAVRLLDPNERRSNNNNSDISHSSNHNDNDALSCDVANVDALVREAAVMRARPWYALRTSMARHGNRHDMYSVCVRLHEQRVRLHNMATRQHATPHALQREQQLLHDLEVAQRRLADLQRATHNSSSSDDDADDVTTALSRTLTSGALVATALITLGVLPRDAVPASHFTPTDFAGELPLARTHVFATPVVFFAT